MRSCDISQIAVCLCRSCEYFYIIVHRVVRANFLGLILRRRKWVLYLYYSILF
jgi:hypothetical protein